MTTYDVIVTKLDVREFGSKQVSDATKGRVLEAARFTGSSRNSQHWRFILVQDPKNLKLLARDSTTGPWVEGANFAVIMSVDPMVPGSAIDAGRAIQDMQVAAWAEGVASGLYTGLKVPEIRRDFGIPGGLTPTAVIGFGYPKRKLLGKKSRKPLSEIAFLERYGSPLGSTAEARGTTTK